MKQTNPGQQKAYEELLTVLKWTIQMLDTNAITYRQYSATAEGEDEFRNWEAALRAVGVKAEVVEGIVGRSSRTHADVQLPHFNQVVKSCAFDNQ